MEETDEVRGGNDKGGGEKATIRLKDGIISLSLDRGIEVQGKDEIIVKKTGVENITGHERFERKVQHY